MSVHWKETARQKRIRQAETIPPEWRLKNIPINYTDSRPIIESCGILSPEELKITNITDGRILVKEICSGALTSVDVTIAFCKRAAVAQQLTGCCTEMFFERGLQRAKELDDHLKQTGKPVGPLHGLPISVKDNHDIEGIDSTVGWVGLIGKPAKQDNLGVQLMQALGAVIYVKTNIPQSLMMSDSYNHVFKQSVNSLNKNLISGGSSGGEGALVGAKGSLVGIGTDIGGSIRVPAVLQGLYGLSPTIGRVHNRDSGRGSKYVVPPVAGPITTSLSSLEFFMDSFCSLNPWEIDPGLLPVPWRQELATPPTRPLKVGFIFYDGVVMPQPPVQRAVREMAEKFRKAGHEVIEWDSSTHRAAYYDLWLSAMLADGGSRCEDLCKLVGEPLIEGMIVGQKKDTLTVSQRMELADRIWDYQYDYLKRWRESGIDAIVMPVLPWVGFKPKTWVQSQQYCGYTAIWNLLNYASLVVPATAVDPALDQPDEAWRNYAPKGFTDDFNHKQYDVELVKGMPVGLQVVGGRFGEEKAVAVAKVIEGFGRATNGA